MARYDFAAPRLFVDQDLGEGALVGLDPGQVNYLRGVLRLGEGDRVRVFNGRDGEWLCALAATGRKAASLRAIAREREQERAPDLHYLFAPLKHARQDYMAQKAVEMGVSRLRPLLTRRTQVRAVNIARLRANAIEAAEQCGVLTIPDIDPLAPIADALAQWREDRLLIFCDEEAPVGDPLERLRAHRGRRALAVLVGPEGGFDPKERERILSLPQAVGLSLGPRILRADTAAVAALGLVQAALGDWR